MGKLPWSELYVTKIYLQCDYCSPFPPFSKFVEEMGFRDFSVKSHQTFLCGGKKWKCVQIKNGIIVVSLLGLVPTVSVYVVSTLPDKSSPHLFCSHLWLVTEKSMA